MKNSVFCGVCGSVLGAEAQNCEVCGADQGEAPEVARVASAPAKPAPSPVYPPSVEESATPSRPQWRLAVIVAGLGAAAVLAFGAVTGNIPVFVLGLDLLFVILLASNFLGLRARLPLLNSNNPLQAAGGWFGFALVGVLAAFAALPQVGGAVPGPTSTATPPGTAAGAVAKGATPVIATTPGQAGSSLAALQVAIEGDRKATATARAGQTGTVMVVGNTGGEGVSIRRTPALSDRIRAWQDGTRMEVIGPDRQAEGKVWKNVTDPAGNSGWVPEEYLLGTQAEPTPAPGATGDQQAALTTLNSITERVNTQMGLRFFERTQIERGGEGLSVTVSDFWYSLPTYVKERTLEMVADNYAAIAARGGLRGPAPDASNYPRTTFYDLFDKELGYKVYGEISVLR